LKILFAHRYQDLPSASPILLSTLDTLMLTDKTCISRVYLAARMVRADLRWRRALELAADNREAKIGRGARKLSTISVGLESPMRARRDATQAREGSQPQKRHGLAAEVPCIDRRRENSVRRVFGLICPYLTSFEEGAPIHVFDQPLP
jgi:hypothetical protein